MTNTRALPRHRRRLLITLGRRIPAFTADVSAGGFCAEMPAVFLPGSQVDGSLSVGELQVPFRGVVTWAKPGDPHTSTRSRFGVRFTEVTPEFREFFRNTEAKHLIRWFT